MANGLDSEIAKLDVKFSPRHTGVSKFFTEYCFYDFWIRYCSPQAVEMTGDGLIVCIHRFKPDATGRDDLAVLDTRYPRSLDGLTAARNDGLTAVEKLYGLPPDIKIIEMNNFPQLTSIQYDAIYRISMTDVIATMSKERAKNN